MYGGHIRIHSTHIQHSKNNNSKGLYRNTLWVSDLGKQSQNLEALVLVPQLTT